MKVMARLPLLFAACIPKTIKKELNLADLIAANCWTVLANANHLKRSPISIYEGRQKFQSGSSLGDHGSVDTHIVLKSRRRPQRSMVAGEFAHGPPRGSAQAGPRHASTDSRMDQKMLCNLGEDTGIPAGPLGDY